ncbi:tol-pal system-associated acyl-CoA thioesterase [Luteimonas aquatica]|uniref:tol-pal system-associated acyl-CoA thioesterase n=1 Tax=Luteimonas aquatica TaxID=450364 RepID=UPI001F580A03|nr:tol-pal system-associated acyl-CoA thioesterase [Luteimonas aquatica]
MLGSSMLRSTMNETFRHPVRVYWEDTDAGGVVYHAQYLAFLERARTEWLRARGHGQELLREVHDLVFVVRAMRIDFRKPARLDDALEVSVALRQCRRASLVIAQAIRRGGEVLLDAEVRIAAVGASGFRPRGIPDALYDELKLLEDTIAE